MTVFTNDLKNLNHKNILNKDITYRKWCKKEAWTSQNVRLLFYIIQLDQR